jgi:hypothetical protein
MTLWKRVATVTTMTIAKAVEYHLLALLESFLTGVLIDDSLVLADVIFLFWH